MEDILATFSLITPLHLFFTDSLTLSAISFNSSHEIPLTFTKFDDISLLFSLLILGLFLTNLQ